MVTTLENKVQSYLPDSDMPPLPSAVPDKSLLIKKELSSAAQRATAKELARIKYKEMRRLNDLDPESAEYARTQERIQAIDRTVAKAGELASGLPADDIMKGQRPMVDEDAHSRALRQEPEDERYTNSPTPNADKAIDAEIAEIEQSPVQPQRRMPIGALASLKGTTRPEIARLMQSLNINLDVQLSKADTANLLAALLTCNDTQLAALAKNKRVPIVIKTIIKRLQDDAKNGSIGTIDYIWEKVFGKGPLRQDETAAQQGTAENPFAALGQGIIPERPVSREAYILIRDTLIK